MPSAKLVTHLLLAVVSLSAAAHRPAPARHHASASKHQSASHKSEAKTKRVTKTTQRSKASPQAKPASARHAAKRHVASQSHHAEAGRHHATKTTKTRHVAHATHQPKEHRAGRQPASRTYRVTATVYQAVPGQTDSSPFITADNSRIRPRYGSRTRWLALSPDLLKRNGGKFNYGDKVQVSHVSPRLDGVYTVHDTMNRRHRHRIDILTHRREKLSVCARDARIRLADTPHTARKSRARATVVAHARPGRRSHTRAIGFGGRASGKRATYLASAIL